MPIAAPERVSFGAGEIPQSRERLKLLEIIFHTHAQPDAAYIFKHVIIQRVS